MNNIFHTSCRKDMAALEHRAATLDLSEGCARCGVAVGEPPPATAGISGGCVPQFYLFPSGNAFHGTCLANEAMQLVPPPHQHRIHTLLTRLSQVLHLPVPPTTPASHPHTPHTPVSGIALACASHHSSIAPTHMANMACPPPPSGHLLCDKVQQLRHSGMSGGLPPRPPPPPIPHPPAAHPYPPHTLVSGIN